MNQMTLQRRPLRAGNVYQFKGYSTQIRIKGISFPGTPDDDGGLPGVAVKWLDNNNGSGWYPFATEAAFWSDIRFQNLVDPENA